MKSKSLTKKLFSVLLSILMLSSFATLSFAEEIKVYEVATEDEMEAAAIAVMENDEGGEIRLTDSITYNTTKRASLFFSSGNVVIDLGGNTLTMLDKTIYNAGCTLTVKNGTINTVTDKYAAICNYLSSENVTYLADDLNIISGYDGVSVYGGVLYSAANIKTGSVGIYNRCWVDDSESNVYVTGGTIESASDYAVYSNSGDSNASIENAKLISNGIFGAVCSWSDYKNSTLKIKDSEIYAYGTGLDDDGNVSHNKGLYLVGTDVTVENSYIYSEYGNAILIFDCSNEPDTGCKLEAKNSTFITDKALEGSENPAVATNYNSSDDSTAYFSGCKIIADAQPAAFYCPAIKELTFDDLAGDTLVSGGLTGIELRRGIMNVNDYPDNENSVVIRTTRATELEYTGENGFSGTTVHGAAIAVSQHIYNKAITVNLNGGTYIGPYAVLEEDVMVNQGGYDRSGHPVEDVVVNIYDAKCEGKVADNNSQQLHNEYLNIYNGVFSDEPQGATYSEETTYTKVTDQNGKEYFVVGDSKYVPAQPDEPYEPTPDTPNTYLCKWCIKYGDKYTSKGGFVAALYKFFHKIVHTMYKIKIAKI